MRHAVTPLTSVLREPRFRPALVCAGVILLLTSWPRVPVVAVTGADKVVHLSMYGVFAFLTLGASRYPRSWSRLILAWAVLAVFGGLDEWHQSFIPGRSASVADWFADATGALLGLLVAYHSSTLSPSRRDSPL
jgi:VanZ family protein